MSIAGKTLFDADTLSEADEIGAALTVAIQWAGSEVSSFLPVAQLALRNALLGLSGRLPTLAGAFSSELAGRASAFSSELAERLRGPVLLFTAGDRRMKEAIATLDRHVQGMIDERRRTGQDTPDLLGRLLSVQDDADGSHMSDKQVRDEVLTLFVAGHETTGSAMGWALYLLAKHPEALARARAEADALGRAPRYEDLPRLRFLQMVFKEAMRLYPTVPLFPRDASAAVQIGGHSLPEGTVFLISPYLVHRRPDLWPDPERFDPERFTPEAEAARPRHAFLPFAAGPRVCIGNHFALMEAPLVLATLLQKADFERADAREIEPEVHITLRAKGGIPMRVHLRNPQPPKNPL